MKLWPTDKRIAGHDWSSMVTNFVSYDFFPTTQVFSIYDLFG